MQLTDEAVQSILTADTLIAHYLRAASGVQNALGTDAMEFDIALGDANRTYPSIWEHLDHARRVLAGRRCDVSAYDRVRAGASTVLGVRTDRSEIERSYTLNGMQESQTISVTFNQDGARRATEACAALKQAMPTVDWKTLDAASRAPAPDVRSGTSPVITLVLVAMALGFVVLRLALR